eukprot:TRINITY_DN351_c0_g1_i11.p2 TRINITY_DN351_c0_g1~~TRINITY_DN351_c0_g1_i11.p2  ORF type:complete len:112 (+),score=1.59 TRINITY_DN351_c0_g1_i11:182-517(+)
MPNVDQWEFREGKVHDFFEIFGNAGGIQSRESNEQYKSPIRRRFSDKSSSKRTVIATHLCPRRSRATFGGRGERVHSSGDRETETCKPPQGWESFIRTLPRDKMDGTRART